MGTKALWAPWRMEYIRRPSGGGCFLCEILPAGNDRANLVLRRDPHAVLLMNRYPYNNGHLLVAPRRHVADLGDLSPEERAAIMDLLDLGVQALRATVRPDGFNLGFNLGGAAGAGLESHLHGHIVPRWSGDTNFMPVLADVKVVPQAMDELWADLSAALAG